MLRLKINIYLNRFSCLMFFENAVVLFWLFDRGVHAGKSNKGARDRRKLREKRRSTGVMHLPSTEVGVT